MLRQRSFQVPNLESEGLPVSNYPLDGIHLELLTARQGSVLMEAGFKYLSVGANHCPVNATGRLRKSY
jgi:hypothetical protein